MWKRMILAACALVLAAGCPLAFTVGSAAALPGSFTFAAAGDFGANTRTSAVLNTLAGAGTDFAVAVGDLSYSEVTPESAWCDFVKSRVGSTYPFELVAGNHEDNGPDGSIGNFAACLPDRLGGLTGSYTKEYYFDYPTSAPLARVIGISPNLAFPGESTYAYTVGSAHYTWLSNAIDSARSAGIPWVIVAMHENCLKAGSSACEIGTGLENLLVAKKVDLILQGHTHTYQRGKQLALGAACPSVTYTAYDADCVVNDGSTGAYTKGAGLVQVISGTGGEAFGSVSTSDPDAKYFAKLMGNGANPSAGFTKFSVTATQLSAQYVAATGSFSDSFTIAGPSGPPGDQPPTALGAALTTPTDTALPVTLQATDPDNCELAFSVVTPPAHGTLSAPANQACAAGSPNHDSATVTYTPGPGFNGSDSFTFKANDGTADSNTATVAVSVTPPGNQAPVALSANLATAQNTALPLTLQATDPDNCEVAFSVVTPPAHGTLSALANQACAAGSPNHDSATATYTPDAGFNGTDSFTFKANDGTIDSNTATVTVTVGTPPPGITFRSASSAKNATATTLTIPRPTGVVAGDVMVAGVGIRGAPAITPPVGWTFIRTDAAGTYTTQALYYRVATASEPASSTWSFSQSVPAAGGISAYQGVNTAAPVNVSAGTGQNVNTTSILAPSVTTTVAGARLVGFFSIGGDNSITPPAGMTERGEADSSAGSNHVTWESSDATQTTAGATGSQVATGTNPHPNVGTLVALTPA